MARTNLVFTPRVTAGSFGYVDLNDIPDDVKEEMEGVYAQLQKLGPNAGSFYVKFDSLGEKNEYIKYAQAYCSQRPEGAIRFRLSPVKGRGKESLEINFRVTDIETDEEKQTREIREATEKANAKAK